MAYTHMGNLHFDITGDNKSLLRNLEGSKQGIRSLTREAEKESMNLDDIMKRIGQSAAAIGVGFSATQLIRDVARVRGEFQQLEVALNTMLGSEEKANALFEQLVNTAAKTPFDLKGVAGGAKQLLAYGVAAEEVNDTIIRLGDIAAGLSIPLGDLVYLYGTTMTQGRLFTQDLRQFMGRGIPLADELAKQFGVAKDAVGELVTAGKVGFPEVEKAIRAMTSEGGKFAGLMENQSKTITGQISNLEDAVDSMFNEIGKSTQGAISGALTTATKLVENYEKVGEAIGVMLTAYGSYKTALFVSMAVQKAEAAVLTEAAVQKGLAAMAGHTLSEAQANGAAKAILYANAQKKVVASLKMLTKAMVANPYVWAAAAITGLVVGVYKLVTAKSAEEKAIERVNSKREKEREQLEAQKNKIDSLISTIKDESRTLTEQANAYDELKKVAPKLTDEYTLLELQAIDTTEALKKYNEQLDGQRYISTLNSLVKYRAMLEEVEDAQGNWNNVSDATKQALRSMYDIGWKGMGLNEVSAHLKADISDMSHEVQTFRNAVESQKPIEVKLLSAENNVFLLQGEFDKINEEYQEAKRKFDDGLISPFELNSIDLRYKMAEAALKKGQNLVDNLKSQIKEEPNYGEEYQAAEKAWIKAKTDLDAATANRAQYTTAQYKSLVKAAKEAEDAYKALGGDTSAKKASKEEEKDYSQQIKDKIQSYVEEKEEQRKHYEDLLKEFETYEQARERIAKEYAVKRAEMINDDGTIKSGFTQGNIDNVNARQQEDEQALDQMFLEKSETYQSWLDSIKSMALDGLRDALVQAKFALELAKTRGDNEGAVIAQGQITTLENAINNADINPDKRSIEDWRGLADVVSEASGVFDELGNSVGGVAGDILESVGGIGSSTVGLINNITQLAEISMEGTKGTADTASESVKAVEKASVILAVISTAIQLITKVVNLAKKIHDSSYDDVIEENQDKIDALKESYEDLEEAASETFGSDKVSKLREMNAALEQQNKLIQEQRQAEEDKKKTDEDTLQSYDDAIKENRKQMEENKKAMEEAIFGDDIASAIENFAEAYGDAISEGKNMSQSMKDHAVQMMKQMVQEQIKAYIAGQGKLEALREKMALYFEDEKFSDTEIAAIKAQAVAIGKDLAEKFAWAEDLLSDEESSGDEGSSKRGIATASQESVDENNGRLMSIQLSMGEIKEQMIYTVTYLATMSSHVSAGNNILSDIREQAVRTNGHLEDIVKYTKPLSEKINEVVSAINRINSK